MKDRFRILIADRNRNVREFLRREFGRDGYDVRLVRDGTELESVVEGDALLDLVILDLEVPLLDESRLQALIEERLPPVPLIVHGHWELCVHHAILQWVSAFVERGRDVEEMKRVVRKVLWSRYPHRFEPSEMIA